MIIYKVTNEINGKAYIGQTIHNLAHRRQRHLYDSRNKKDNMQFHKAIRKYGVHSFEWKVLHTCDTLSELNKLEIFYIRFYNTFLKGYNATEGGSNPPHTEEILKKISKGNKGKIYTKETIRRMSEAKKGKTHTKEARKKISEARSFPMVIKGKYFASQKEAASFMGMSPQAFFYRLHHKTKWQDYNYA